MLICLILRRDPYRGLEEGCLSHCRHPIKMLFFGPGWFPFTVSKWYPFRISFPSSEQLPSRKRNNCS